jgi:hypothetical protein
VRRKSKVTCKGSERGSKNYCFGESEKRQPNELRKVQAGRLISGARSVASEVSRGRLGQDNGRSREDDSEHLVQTEPETEPAIFN